ncbi:MAG: oligosaccharide flippase family protein [Elusimicrobia bacterium]|nr:oligosaccharide flippase family protein [Elusimicrobiota bacterium]
MTTNTAGAKFSTGTLRIFGADTLSKIFEIILSIYVARHLGPLQLGHLVILLAISGYAEKLGRLSLDHAAVFLLGKERCSLRQAHRTLTMSSLILSLPWILLGFLLKNLITAHFLKLPEISPNAYLLALAHIPISFLLINSRKLLTQAGEVAAYNLTIWPVPVAQLIFLAASSLILPEFNLAAVLGASLAAQALAVFYAHGRLLIINPNPEKYNPTFVPELLRWGWRFYQTMIPQFLQIRIDLMLVAFFLDPTQTAYYSLATTASQLLWRLPQVANVLFYPMSAKMTDQEACAFAANITRQLALWMTLGAACGSLFIYPATQFLYGSQYLHLVGAFLILLPGTISMGVAKSLYEYFNARGLTQVTRQTAAITLAANVLLNLILLPILGTAGAALTSSLTYLMTWAMLARSFIKRTALPANVFWSFRQDIPVYQRLIKSMTGKTADFLKF